MSLDRVSCIIEPKIMTHYTSSFGIHGVKGSRISKGRVAHKLQKFLAFSVKEDYERYYLLRNYPSGVIVN